MKTETEIPGVVQLRINDKDSTQNGRLAQVMICSRDGEHRLVFAKSPNGNSLPQTGVLKIARQKGWQVSKKGKHFCPFCMEQMGRKRPGVPKGVSVLAVRDGLVPSTAGTKQPLRPAPKPPHAPTQLADQLIAMNNPEPRPVREKSRMPTTTTERPLQEVMNTVVMSPADRRAIFRALDGVYDDKHQTYFEGYGDQSVADKLSLPPAWVATVRAENFGPAGPDPETVEVVQKLVDHMRKLDDISEALMTLTNEVQKDMQRLIDLKSTALR